MAICSRWRVRVGSRFAALQEQLRAATDAALTPVADEGPSPLELAAARDLEKTRARVEAVVGSAK